MFMEVLTKQDTRSLQILLVDDDAEDRLFITELLEEAFENKLDLKIETAANYADAIACIRKNQYSLALLDFQIGFRNGLDLLHRIHEMGRNFPVVFITGQGDEHVAVEAIKGGAVDYLLKGELNTELIQETILKVAQIPSSEVADHYKQLFTKAAKSKFDFHNFIYLDQLVKMFGGKQ
jgi:DNA-binding NtrC family response regulator